MFAGFIAKFLFDFLALGVFGNPAGIFLSIIELIANWLPYPRPFTIPENEFLGIDFDEFPCFGLIGVKGLKKEWPDLTLVISSF